MNGILGVQGGERKSVRAGAVGGPQELNCLVRNQDLDERGIKDLSLRAEFLRRGRKKLRQGKFQVVNFYS